MDESPARRGHAAGCRIRNDQALARPQVETNPDDCFGVLLQQFLVPLV
jgi:hypothetical protein